MLDRVVASAAATLAAGAIVVAFVMWADLREIKNDQPVSSQQLEAEKTLIQFEYSALRAAEEADREDIHMLEARVRALEIAR